MPDSRFFSGDAQKDLPADLQNLIWVKPTKPLLPPLQTMFNPPPYQTWVYIPRNQPGCPEPTHSNSGALRKLVPKTEDGKHYGKLDAVCSAVMISGRRMLTAAHCTDEKVLEVRDATRGKPLPVSCKYLGGYDPARCRSNPQSCVADLAVCTLPEAAFANAAASGGAGAAVSVVAAAQQRPSRGEPLEVAGFGFSQDAEHGLVRGNYCSSTVTLAYDGSAGTHLSVVEGGAVALAGDSGGPVFWSPPGAPGSRVLVGIITVTNSVNRTWFVDLRHPNYSKLLGR